MATSDDYSLLLTTSRKPPSRGRNFVKELNVILPKSIKINRGHLNIGQIFVNAQQKNCSRVLILSCQHGNPSLLSGYQQLANKNALEYQWIFDWRITSLKLESELNIKQGKRSSTSLYWDFIDVQPEIESLLNSFFHITKTSDEHWTIKVEISHLHSGYLFQCLLRDGTIIAPEFIIEEITIAEE